MLRRYLINIHRFYHYYYPNSFDHAIMPVVVFSLSLNLFLYIVDSLLFDKLIFIQLANIHDYMVTVPTYMILLLHTYGIELDCHLMKSLRILTMEDGLEYQFV